MKHTYIYKEGSIRARATVDLVSMPGTSLVDLWCNSAKPLEGQINPHFDAWFKDVVNTCPLDQQLVLNGHTGGLTYTKYFFPLPKQENQNEQNT